MRIACFSPLPPKRTGIATYSHHLSIALSEIAEVELFDAGLAYPPSSKIPVYDFVANPRHLARLDEYDVCLYHLGNCPWVHLDIYKVFLRKPGVVVLHDAVLYYLIAGLGYGGFIKEFCLTYGLDRLDELQKLIADCPEGDLLRYPFPERYPMLHRVLAHATGMVVHSQTSRKFLEDLGYKGKIHVINFLAYPHNESLLADSELCRLRTQLSVEDDQILIGSFGFIGPTKRMNVLIEALSRLEKKINYKLLVVGQGIDLSSLASSKHLQNKIVCLGYVSDDEFVQMLKLTDIVVNLRYPSMGETSATLIQAFSLSRACIVTNHGWFSEIPDDCAWKIGFGESENDELESALLKLSDDKPRRIELGARAKMFVDEECAATKVATRYVEAVGGERREDLRTVSSNVREEVGWVRGYFNQRLNEILPSDSA